MRTLVLLRRARRRGRDGQHVSARMLSCGVVCGIARVLHLCFCFLAVLWLRVGRFASRSERVSSPEECRPTEVPELCAVSASRLNLEKIPSTKMKLASVLYHQATP